MADYQPMKRSELRRKTPLKQGTSKLKRTELKRTELKRGTMTLKPGGQLARQGKPMRAKSKNNSDPRPKTGEAELCRGQPCYLLVPGVLRHPVDTVVPCHSNQARHGKGKGIKAHDVFTVPGCVWCHAEIDQGNRFTREEKFALWDAGYERWKPVRDALLGAGQDDPPLSVSVAL